MGTNALKERLTFRHDWASGQWSMTEPCERYGVARPTRNQRVAWKVVEGPLGLTDRSRVPHACPHRTSAVLEALILADRRKYGW